MGLLDFLRRQVGRSLDSDQTGAISIAIRAAGGADALLHDSTFAVRVVEQLSGGSPEFNADSGWLVSGCPAGATSMHPWHVYAVAALMRADEILANRRAKAFPDQILDTLVREAHFMLGRIDQQAAEMALSRRKRSARGALGGRKHKFSNADLLAFRDRWIAEHRKSRGWKTAAALEFGVSDGTIRARTAKLENSQ